MANYLKGPRPKRCWIGGIILVIYFLANST